MSARAQDAPDPLPDLQPLTITHDETEYENLVYIPGSYVDHAEDPYPMLVVFHGAGSSARRMSIMTGFDAMAERDGAFIAYADSPVGYWDYGAGLAAWEPVRDQVDHPAAVMALIASMQATYRISDIYLVGFSNGARMAWRMACELGERTAGVSGVAGTLSTEVRDDCPDTLQAPVFYMQGTDDGVIPWEGKPLSLAGQIISEAMAVPAMMEWWAAHNGCTGEPTPMTLPDANPDDNETLTQFDYDACNGNARVRLVRVNGGGHNWTGGLPNLVPNDWHPGADASSLIWEFFGLVGTQNRYN